MKTACDHIGKLNYIPDIHHTGLDHLAAKSAQIPTTTPPSNNPNQNTIQIKNHNHPSKSPNYPKKIPHTIPHFPNSQPHRPTAVAHPHPVHFC